MSDSDAKVFLSIQELASLYKKVKEGIILDENFDPNDRIHLGALNELRNALDHIMRAVLNPDNYSKEVIDARDHLLRAGYDAFESLAMTASQTIISSLQKFDKDVIATICPDYYRVIKPKIIDLKKELAKIRSGRDNSQTDILKIETLTDYTEKANELFEFSKTVSENIPEMVEFQKSKRKLFWKDQLLRLLIGIFGVILGFLLALCFLHKK